MKNNNQLELSLQNTNSVCASLDRRELRLRRASLWFQRMRQVVEQAIDHLPVTEPRWINRGGR
jgi:hypothetical protein